LRRQPRAKPAEPFAARGQERGERRGEYYGCRERRAGCAPAAAECAAEVLETT
jgi:hypothetical protein